MEQGAIVNSDESGFEAGTLVHTKEGLVPIENIRVGDLILSYPYTESPPVRMHTPYRLESEYTYRLVTKTLAHNGKPICHITCLDTANGINNTLKVTPTLPIWSKGRGWIPAAQLKVGHVLLCSDFANVLVVKVGQTNETARVYDLEVEEFRTYYVESLGAWVHGA